MNIEPRPSRIPSPVGRSVAQRRLVAANIRHRGTGGVSANNRRAGFVPAFRDGVTGDIFRSRFANGQPAPIHMLEGLPDHLLQDPCCGDRVESGFLCGFEFYTREQARCLMRLGA